ncbi:hypothetical protein Ciccas_011742, partial [Cichlidogyrus casuarinus]
SSMLNCLFYKKTMEGPGTGEPPKGVKTVVSMDPIREERWRWLNLETWEWDDFQKPIPFLPVYIAVNTSCATFCNDCIYILGGRDEKDGIQQWCWTLPLGTREWQRGPDLTGKRAKMCSIALNNKIYSIGGIDGAEKDVRTVEVLDLSAATKQWKQIASMNHVRKFAACTVFGGCIYVFGGSDGEPLNTAEKYDPQTDTWTIISSMTVARFSAAVGVYGNKIYVAGGLNIGQGVFQSVVEVYDPETDSWDEGPELCMERFEGTLFIHQGQLAMAGGSACPAEVLDKESNTWELKLSNDSPKYSAIYFAIY